MRNTLANPTQHLVSAVLVVCLSVCCCQAGIVMHGLSGDHAIATETSCGGCCSTDAPDSDTPETPAAPEKGCQTCCIKGTGLKTPTLVLDAPVAVAAPVHETTSVVASPPAAVLARPVDAAPSLPRPTLLRLRCALVV